MLKHLSTSALTLLVAAAGLGACVDAKKRFDEFDDRVPVIDASLIDRPTVPLSDINGTWYLVVKALGANIHMFVTWDLTINGPVGTLDGTYQPLSTKPVDMPPRLPVGGPLTANDVAVDDTASFTAALMGILDPAANPLTENLLGSQVNLVGNIKSMDLVCGTPSGSICVGSPAPCMGGIPVEPGTFAAVRVTGVNALPALPPTDRCPE